MKMPTAATAIPTENQVMTRRVLEASLVSGTGVAVSISVDIGTISYNSMIPQLRLILCKAWTEELLLLFTCRRRFGRAMHFFPLREESWRGSSWRPVGAVPRG